MDTTVPSLGGARARNGAAHIDFREGGPDRAAFFVAKIQIFEGDAPR
jgi:hypothetical protein